MTCIVALETKTGVIMGGDSATTDEHLIYASASPKVFLNNGFLIGFTTSWRMGQLLQYVLQPELPGLDEDPERFMVTAFVPAVRECLGDNNWSRNMDNQDSGGQFLVGFRNHLFYVDDDFHVSRALDGIQACGSGEAVARGALWATETYMEPVERVRIALHAAARYTTTVRAPFKILSTE